MEPEDWFPSKGHIHKLGSEIPARVIHSICLTDFGVEMGRGEMTRHRSSDPLQSLREMSALIGSGMRMYRWGTRALKIFLL